MELCFVVKCFTVDRLVDFGEETARSGSVSRTFHD